MDKWDDFFLNLAKTMASCSKDPSTQTGAVIADGKKFISAGYNGFPMGVRDDPERYANREMKYEMIVHCEMNAILFAKRDLEGCTLYTWPFMSCSRCAACVIQAGIKRCVAPRLDPESELYKRWEKTLTLSKMMFEEAGVQIYEK